MLRFSNVKAFWVTLVCVIFMIFALPNVMSEEMQAKMPSWLQPLNLGLDLKGGAHLLFEVKVDKFIDDKVSSLQDEVRNKLRRTRGEKIAYRNLKSEGLRTMVTIIDESKVDEAKAILRKGNEHLSITSSGNIITLEYSEREISAIKKDAVERSMEIIRRRIDELGTKEPVVQRQGDNRIVVQIPGLSDPEQVKSLIGKTAKMDFRLVDEENYRSYLDTGRVPPDSEVLDSVDEGGGKILVKKAIAVPGTELTNSQMDRDNFGRPVVTTVFSSEGAAKFAKLTSDNVGKRFAIVLDGKVISAPTIQDKILGGRGQISGNFTTKSAQELAMLLRSGALPADIEVIEERSVGPGLGQDSIDHGKKASVIGLIAIIAFAIIYYGALGVFVALSLIINLVMLIGVMSAFGITLTLPGIAGMVLTIGMAIDANVLIFERTKEEKRKGKSPFSSLEDGFNIAWGTILDSNLTTLFAAFFLFQFGTGAIRGFAVTLSLGILTSMFTSVTVLKMMIWAWMRVFKPKDLPL